MRISNSKLNTILSCPMTYYLNYVQEISLKEKPPALAIGSAVHHGLEVGSSDLTEYFKENGNKEQRMSYSKEQMLCECIVEGYFKHKNEIYDKILNFNGEKLNITEEYHELELYADLPSGKYNNQFFGIIDLLLLTDKGFIILDYKTSSDEPDWTAYLEQIYRYVFLIKSNFPDVPILKIGIINLKKTKIRQKLNENDDEYKNRIKFEYELNDEKYINYHEYLAEELDSNLIEMYINNLYRMCDGASDIVASENWFINYTNANDKFRSQYWDIFYQTEGCETLYQIKDIDGENRDCVKIDMLTVFPSLQERIVNKYEKYKSIRKNYENIDSFRLGLSKSDLIVDNDLLKMYEEKYIEESKKEVSNEESRKMV